MNVPWNPCHILLATSVFPTKLSDQRLVVFSPAAKRFLSRARELAQDQHCVASFEHVVTSHTSHSQSVRHGATDSTTT